MDNEESWKALLRALDSMPHSTSSEISFPCTTKASGAQECVINFSMNPLSDEWKKSHIERSPNIAVFDNLSMLPAMGEEEVTFGEKKTFVVGSEGGWRAINTVVELAGIELEGEEEVESCGDEVELEESVKDVAMEDSNSNARDEVERASEGDSCSVRKGRKRSADSYSGDESAKESDSNPSARKQTIGINNFVQPPESTMDQAYDSTSGSTSSKSKHPKKKKRRANRDKVDHSCMNNGVPTPTNATTDSDSSHLVEIARLCELMSKPTSTPSDHSSEADEDRDAVPKIKLVRRKANKLQCRRCLELGTICDTQTPCSPCKRLNRGPHVCRPCEKDRDAVREFALGKNGGVVKKVVFEKKPLFFDKRGRFCKKEEAVRSVGEGEVTVPLEGGKMEV